jgi:hypothetical protein
VVHDTTNASLSIEGVTVTQQVHNKSDHTDSTVSPLRKDVFCLVGLILGSNELVLVHTRVQHNFLGVRSGALCYVVVVVVVVGFSIRLLYSLPAFHKVAS